MVEGYLGTEKDVVARRVGAILIDTVVLTVVGMLLLAGSFASGSLKAMATSVVLLTVLFMVYGWVLEGWMGQTIGKRLLSIVVVKEDGSPCGFGPAFLRNFFRFVDGLFYYAVGFIAMALTEKRQRIGDRLANTVVVRAGK
jgi:uncharacterized RDD family membrane protein YckC